MGCKSLSFRCGWKPHLPGPDIPVGAGSDALIRCGWKPHLPGPFILVGAVSDCALPVRLETEPTGA